jgi:TolB-like protein/DNA-binding winged helix-turn-helix (wHTH) protein
MPSSFNDLYRFDDFELDPSRRTFVRNGTPVSVSPKAFEVLTYLVANPGRVITKDELLKAIWPDSFVEESNLAQHISWLRKALADRSNYIVTIPGRGYQFAAKVQTETPLELLPEKPFGDIRVQRVRERTHVVIEESLPAAALASSAVTTLLQPAFPDSNAPRLIARKTQVPKVMLVLSLIASVAIIAGYLGLHRFAGSPFHRTLSIAVLPFTNRTGDPSQEYVSDGVTEEIINRLMRTEAGQLRVIARTSSMSYKDTRKNVREIARELDVQYVLEGSVQSEGNHLHITAQLIRGSDETHLWADSFDGETGEILEFENRLTSAVAQSLSLSVLAGKSPEYAPINSAAHDAYLQGLYFLSQRSQSGFQDALRSFGGAVARDPRYARAYAMLAVTYNLMGQYNWMDTHQAHSQAQAAAQQAIATDASLAEAHAALGFNRWFYEWNPAAAEKELLRALQLEPTNVDARHWYASVLMTSGRWDDAEKQMRTALALDPKSPILRTNLGWLYYFRRQYPLAIQEMASVANDNPDFVTAHYKLWWVYSVTGDAPRAWNELRTLAHLMFTPENEKRLIEVYEQQGYAASLKAMVGFTGGFYQESLLDDARCMMIAGDKPGAYEYLERALKNREGWMIFLETDPAFDPLRSDAEYSRLVRELHAVAGSSSSAGARSN